MLNTQNQSEKPKLSVIMGTYNCKDTISLALKSILGQTYTDWECIICDDGSDDGTYELLKQAVSTNPKFKLLKNERNLGLAATLNRCIDHTRGEYLVRHDGDDFSSPDRFKEQAEFLDSNKDVSVLGTYAGLFDGENFWGHLKPPFKPRIMDWIRGMCVIHASVFMRKSDILDIGKYDDKAIRLEDYDLWARLVSKGYSIRTLEKTLYFIRWSKATYARRKLKFRIAETVIRFNSFRRLKASPFLYIYTVRPLLIGLIPPSFMRFYHYCKFKRNRYFSE